MLNIVQKTFMLQTINMLDLRKKARQILDEIFYRKDCSDIEIYTLKQIEEFNKEDRLSKVLLAKVKKIL